MTVVSDFFRDELNAPVAAVLRRAIADGGPSAFTFNLFNVRLDPMAGFVVVQDELDPDRVEAVPLRDFARMVDEGAGGAIQA